MLPKTVRKIYFSILRSGPVGLKIAEAISWCFYWMVKILRLPPPDDLSCLVLISHKYKFIYIGVPKVATRSFLNLMTEEHVELFETEWHERKRAHYEAKAQYPDYYTFSFVRNPWSRIVSCYNSKIGSNIIGFRARILSFYKGLEGGMEFTDFVHWLGSDEGRDEIADRHWMSQYHFLTGEDGQDLCDFIGRYESLHEDWAKVREILGVPEMDLPHKGWISAERSNYTDYRTYYDDETRAIIAERYARDIEMLGYEF